MKRTLVVLLFAALAARAELTPQELRGRQIYRTGESPSGQPIVALVGPEDIEVPAASMPCMSCHGRDGRGKEEGGVRPSNLQWHVLTKPYSVPDGSGRSHPPYTPALLKRAITMGTDPARQHLNPVMPRYRLSMRDADDLIAYLARIGTDTDPGLTDDSIAVGLLLPKTSEGDAIRQALTKYFDGINAAGGIFGRSVRVTQTEEPFAIIAVQAPAEKGIPTITTVSTPGDIVDRDVIHLLPTIEEQSLALIGDQKVRIVHDESTADLAARLASHGADDSTTVLFLSNGSALRTLLASGTAKTILIPAAFTSDAIYSAPPSVRIAVALPTTRPVRETALAAAALLVRALERAGRDLDRETLAGLLATTRRAAARDCTIVRVENGKLVADHAP